MPASRQTRIALTCGDPAGVGPEIIGAWLAAHPDEARAVAVIGPARWLGSLLPVVCTPLQLMGTIEYEG